MAKEEKKQEAEGQEVGIVEHYYGKLGVAVIELSGTLKVGDKIKVKGATTNFEQKVESMQIERDSVEEAGAGDKIGIKVNDRCRGGDHVFKISA